MKTLSLFALLLTVIAFPLLIKQKKRWKGILLPIQRDQNVRYDVESMLNGDSI